MCQEHSFPTIFKHIDWTCTLALFYIQYLTYLANSKKVEFALQLFLGNQQESRDCNLTRPDSACSGDHNDDDDDDDDDGEIREHMLKFYLDSKKLRYEFLTNGNKCGKEEK